MTEVEVEAIAAELEAAGLLAVESRDDGDVAYTLTPAGDHVARQMKMSGEDDAAALRMRSWADAHGRLGSAHEQGRKAQ